MSLTGLLGEKGSPLRAAFRQWLPYTPRFITELNREVAAVAPLIGTSLDPGLSGSAIDFRLRYYFGVQPLENTVAWHGAELMAEALVEDEIETEADPVKVITEVGSRLLRFRTVGRALPEEAERDFTRLCVVLAYFEQFARSGLSVLFDALAGGRVRSLDDVLVLPQEEVVADVITMSQAFLKAQYPQLVARNVILNPVFTGSGDVGGADADIIAGDSLIEFKSTAKARPFDGEDVYQLLSYPCLDYEEEYEIRRVGFSLVRRNFLREWDISQLVAVLSRDELTYTDLRRLFRSHLKDRRRKR